MIEKKNEEADNKNEFYAAYDSFSSKTKEKKDDK